MYLANAVPDLIVLAQVYFLTFLQIVINLDKDVFAALCAVSFALSLNGFLYCWSLAFSTNPFCWCVNFFYSLSEWLLCVLLATSLLHWNCCCVACSCIGLFQGNLYLCCILTVAVLHINLLVSLKTVVSCDFIGLLNEKYCYITCSFSKKTVWVTCNFIVLQENYRFTWISLFFTKKTIELHEFHCSSPRKL